LSETAGTDQNANIGDDGGKLIRLLGRRLRAGKNGLYASIRWSNLS
jgi:hypothetical protein